MNCPKCNAEIDDNAFRCFYCGKILREQPELSYDVTPKVIEGGGKSRTGLIFFIIILLILAVGIIIIVTRFHDRRIMSSAWNEVYPLTQMFYDATIRGQVNELMELYHFPVEVYFGKHNLSYAQVKLDAENYFARWTDRSGTLLALESVNWNPDQKRLTTRIKYNYRFLSRNGRLFTGVSDTYLVWAKFGSDWKVVEVYERVERNR